MADKLNLKNVTLFCIDDISTQKSSELLESVSSQISFGDVKLFSSRDEQYVTNKLNKPINSLHDYSVFAVRDLKNYIDTEFAMCVQRDGYPLNIAAWKDNFLKYDYIGAPWLWVPVGHRSLNCPTGRCVGNGGFSIRSKKIMEEASNYAHLLQVSRDKASLKHKIADTEDKENEDVFICRTIGKQLQSVGIKFAPAELAHFFSVENMMYTGQFGFHGKNTMELNKKIGLFK